METASTSTSTTTVTPKKSKGPLIVGLVLLALLLLCICIGISAFIITRINQNTAPTDNSAKSCQYNGATYANGISFKSTDGCNTCSCANGQALCTLIACNTSETPTPAPNPTGIEETLIGKLQVTDSDYFYGTTKYPESIMGLKAADLVAMTCYPAYTTTGQSAFLNADDQPIRDNTIKAFMDSVPYQEGMHTISWCVTDSGRYIVEYGACASGCGGGVATNFYFGEIKNNAMVKKTLIPNQIGAYPACDTTLALSKNNELYVRCLGGEVRSTAAIYKVFLNDSNYTEITRVSY